VDCVRTSFALLAMSLKAGGGAAIVTDSKWTKKRVVEREEQVVDDWELVEETEETKENNPAMSRCGYWPTKSALAFGARSAPVDLPALATVNS